MVWINMNPSGSILKVLHEIHTIITTISAVLRKIMMDSSGATPEKKFISIFVSDYSFIHLTMKTAKIHVYLTALLVLVVFLHACKKDAGEGGTSKITGRVIVHDFDAAFADTANPVIYPGVSEDVFVIYGADHSTYDNDYKTSYNGTYEFNYLQKGRYRIFAYSKDSTGAYNGTFNANRPKVPVFQEIEITSNGSTVPVPDIIILKNNQ